MGHEWAESTEREGPAALIHEEVIAAQNQGEADEWSRMTSMERGKIAKALRHSKLLGCLQL